MELEEAARLVHPWPKADLHCHLDGSLRPETLAELAGALGVELAGALGAELAGASPGQVRRAIRAGAICESLLDYLAAFRLTLAVLQTAPALRRVAREVVEDAAQETVRLLELRFCPFLHTRGGLAPEAAVDAALEGLAEGAAATGTRVGLILCAMREREPDEGAALVELALRGQGAGVVGVDLAGPEAGHPAQPWARAFRRARDAGLGVTVHAGEADGPSSVWSALRDCGATRIGHACRAVEDPALLEALAEGGVVVESCPLSNVQTRAVDSLAAHPLRELREAGVRVAIATDNRLITDTTVTLELARVAAALDLGPEDLEPLVIAGLEGAFVSDEVARELVAEARRAFASVAPE